ncbi:MAG TPA: glutamine--fructose-6-phosphate transaminase (isomerizing) [Ruminococcaceae bacterium]|nr:glutamine--fructose-6-phosphate transaminase (isomerizing) [Oscillospiraceae bacterium]
MCGIVGYVGDKQSAPLLIEGLEKLAYRGYDSAGVAVIENGKLRIDKAKGHLEVLSERIDGGAAIQSNVGIGHTRWATHGRPSDENSHPHRSGSGRFAVVHNGIIENYVQLKAELIDKGVEFCSETDTEVIAHLLEELYDGELLSTVAKVIGRLQGSYALGILCEEHPDEIVAIRSSSPLIVGLSDAGNFIASDIPAILSHTRKIYHLENDELVLLKGDGVSIYTLELEPVLKKVEEVTWDVAAAEKGGYAHFMIKEIIEQPRALQDTISPRVDDNGEIVLDGITLTAQQLKNIKKIYIVACGSAYHVGVVGKYVLEKLTRIPTEADLASEFRYRSPLVDESTLCIIISQSGETADTLAALREAKERGARVLSIVNVVGSSIANESDDVLYTWAGPEIAVATTKAYSTQLVMLDLIALYIAKRLGRITKEEMRGLLSSIIKLPGRVEAIIESYDDRLRELAEKFKDYEHAYFLGRNVDYAVALEASLKLKEISYIHSEAYAAGELKHGTISLIEENTLVVALAGCHRLFAKTLSNIKEVKARGAYVLAVTTEDNTAIEQEADDVLYIPCTKELLMPSLEVVPMQLLGYYIALARGCDIDKPRNLAKSVTVE